MASASQYDPCGHGNSHGNMAQTRQKSFFIFKLNINAHAARDSSSASSPVVLKYIHHYYRSLKMTKNSSEILKI